MTDAIRHAAIARLPVLGWSTYAGQSDAPLSSIDQQPNVLYTSSGRAAIALALRVLGCRPGDRILVPTYHCPTMIAPVVRLGAIPEFYPVTSSGAPSMDFLRGAKGARAILVAHYFGFPQPLASLRQFCDANGIAIIEDCAHAFFGVVDGKPVGTWGDVAVASLTKFFPVTEGGCLVSSNHGLDGLDIQSRSLKEELKAGFDAIEMGARHHRFPGLGGALRAAFALKDRLRGRRSTLPAVDMADTIHPASYEQPDEPITYSATRASRWTVRSAHRRRIVELRRRNYERLTQLLDDAPGASPLWPALPPGVAPYVFPLRVTNPQPRYRALRAERIPLFRWDRVWPGTPPLPGDYGMRWSTEIFQLPCHQDLSEDDLDTINAVVRRVFTLIA